MTPEPAPAVADLRVPESLQKRRAITPTSTDAYFFERYLRQRPEMRAILDAGGLKGLETVVDFGGHVGGWAWVMAESCQHVTVLAVDQNILASGADFARDNGLDAVDFVEISTEALAAVPPLDGVLCVGTLQVMNHAEIRQFLQFAQGKLRPGGRLLCNTASPRMLLDWTLRLRRVRVDGWLGQLSWAYTLVRALGQRRVAHDDRQTYCLRPAALIRTVEEHGFRLTRAPRELRSLPVFREWELSSGYESPALLPYYDWYVFERTAAS